MNKLVEKLFDQNWNYKNRDNIIKRLQENHYDIIIIGSYVFLSIGLVSYFNNNIYLATILFFGLFPVSYFMLGVHKDAKQEESAP